MHSVFLVKSGVTKPRVQTLVVSRYPAPATIEDFVLLILPPRGPHLTPLATGSVESDLLVSPLLGGPARHRPFEGPKRRTIEGGVNGSR
jgi:hypothetical protein